MSNASRVKPESFLRWKPVLLNFARSLFNNQHRYYHTEVNIAPSTLRINLGMSLRAWFEANEEGDKTWDIFELDYTDKQQLGNLYCYYCFGVAQIPSAEGANFRQGVTIFNRVRLAKTAISRPLPPGRLQFPPITDTPIAETRGTNPLRGGTIKLTDCLQKDLIPHTNTEAIESAAVLISSGFLTSVYLTVIPANIDELRDNYGLDTLEHTPTLYQLL